MALFKRHRAPLAFGCVLFASVFYGYFWSLYHIHRSDQWWWLMNTLDFDGFWEAGTPTTPTGRPCWC